MAEKRGGAFMAGVVMFAGALLLINGLLNIFQGLVALFSDERLVLTPNKLVVVDTTGWGWVLIISGLLMLAVGAGVISAQTWGRITAIVLVCVHAVVQIAWFGAYPAWSLLMIAMDAVILFALTVRWSEVRDRFGETPWSDQDEVRSSATEQRIPPMG